MSGCTGNCQQGRFCTCARQREPSKADLILCAVAMFAAVFVPVALWIVGAIK